MDRAISNDLTDVHFNLQVMGSLARQDWVKLRLVAKNSENEVDTEARTIRTHQLNIDQRCAQFVCRYLTSDSRQEVVAFAKHVIDQAERLAEVAYKSYNEQAKGRNNMPLDERLQTPLTHKTSDGMFVRTATQVLEMLKIDLLHAKTGMETLVQTTYSADKQTTLNIQTNVLQPIDCIVSNITDFFQKSATRAAGNS